jgi:hypothetical protein
VLKVATDTYADSSRILMIHNHGEVLDVEGPSFVKRSSQEVTIMRVDCYNTTQKA